MASRDYLAAGAIYPTYYTGGLVPVRLVIIESHASTISWFKTTRFPEKKLDYRNFLTSCSVIRVS